MSAQEPDGSGVAGESGGGALQIFEFGEDRVGWRLDLALSAALERSGAQISRSQLRRSFAAGSVCVAGKAVKASLKLKRPVRVSVELVPPEPLADARPQDIPLTVAHEDEAVLVVDKPANMVVHSGAGHSDGTLVNAVLFYLQARGDELPRLPGNGPERPGIVHRLDKDTSGLIAVAKTAAAMTFLARQFSAHTIERAYFAVVSGVPRWPTGRLRVETLHGRDPNERTRFSPHVDRGRLAVTTFYLERALGRDGALLRCELETGRTHQIRMHARHVGHPIVGDQLYQRKTSPAGVRRLGAGLGRHALHAAVLGFDHPGGHHVRFESSLPPSLTSLCEAMRRL